MLNMRVLGVAHLSSQLRSTQPTPLRMRFQFPNLHRQLNVSAKAARDIQLLNCQNYDFCHKGTLIFFVRKNLGYIFFSDGFASILKMLHQ